MEYKDLGNSLYMKIREVADTQGMRFNDHEMPEILEGYYDGHTYRTSIRSLNPNLNRG